MEKLRTVALRKSATALEKLAPGKKPRKLVDLVVDEVSLVDQPANEIEFAMLKRRDDGEEIVLTDVMGDIANAFERFSETIRVRMEKVLEEKPNAIVTLNALLLDADERAGASDLLDSVEKVFGPNPFPFPFRSRPYPFDMTKQEPTAPPVGKFDARMLWRAVTGAMGVPGTPDDVKKALQGVLDVLKPLIEASKGDDPKDDDPPAEYVPKADFDALKSDFEKFVEATTNAIQSLSPKPEEPKS